MFYSYVYRRAVGGGQWRLKKDAVIYRTMCQLMGSNCFGSLSGI